MVTSYRVGGEVDSFCTRCQLTLAHTILALVGQKIARVRCNTCGGDHAFRAGPQSSPNVARRTAAPKAEKVIVSFEQQLAGKDVAGAPPYSPKHKYALDQVIHHPTFGYGIVTSVRDDKVEVAFKASSKTLVHNRPGAAAQRPSFQPPRSPTEGPADKPMAKPNVDAPPTPDDSVENE